MKNRFLLRLGVFALVTVTFACATGTASSPGPEKKGYARGEIVTITGVASDLANRPVGELEVVLEASRHGFDYLRLRKRRPVVRKIETTTSADGAFELRWPWDKGFNRFSLAFGITVAEPGGDRFRVLHREDLSKRILHGSPVVASVQVQDTSFLESFLSFRAGLDTEDQRRVYREAGKPDKVRERTSSDGIEFDWWYFELGKVYRFRDGKLQEVENFEPVQPFDS